MWLGIKNLLPVKKERKGKHQNSINHFHSTASNNWGDQAVLSLSTMAFMLSIWLVFDYVTNQPINYESFDTEAWHADQPIKLPIINASPTFSQTKEALLWLSVLKSYSDVHLPGDQLALKYKNMSIAATVLSASSHSKLRKRYWSEKAVKYGKMANSIMQAMVPNKDAFELEEVNTRLLIALAMNYYEGGRVMSIEIKDQFEKISPKYLIRTGFCTNRILRSLHSDGIIRLPEIHPFKYT